MESDRKTLVRRLEDATEAGTCGGLQHISTYAWLEASDQGGCLAARTVASLPGHRTTSCQRTPSKASLQQLWRDADPTLATKQPGLLGTWHTSCQVTTFLTTASMMFHSIVVVVSVCLFALFWWLCVFLWCCCCLCFCFFLSFISGTWHCDHRKLTTVLASLAVISTASKHLHNDLAKAIEALEQKK